MTTASTRKKAPPHGIVTQKQLTGMRLYERLLKRLEGSVAMRESAFVEREYRGAQRFKNVVMTTLTNLQKRHIEVQAGFAAMIGDLLAVQLDGGSHDAKHVRKLLTVISNATARGSRIGCSKAPRKR